MTELEQLSLFDDGSLKANSKIEASIVPFLDFLRGEGKTENTIKSFRSDMNLVCEYLGKDRPLGSITTDDLNAFMQWLEFGRGIPCSKKSYARRVTTLKVLFKWLKDRKVVPTDPADKLIQRSGPAPLQPVLNEEEVQSLIASGHEMRRGRKPDTRPVLLVLLLLETGIKKSEAVRLERDHVEGVEGASPQLLITYKRQNVFKERRLAISLEWVQLLQEYLDQYKPKDNLIFDCTPRNLEYVLTDLQTYAGVETRVSFETLRWTSAVRDYMAGMDTETLREKMGLSEISWRETGQKIMKLASQLREEKTESVD